MSLCAPMHVQPAAIRSLQAVVADMACDGEKRRARRSGFAYRLLLTPLDGDASPAEPIYVEGRDISARGLGFQHHERLPYRRVRLSAADPELAESGFADLEIDLVLRWCRFVSPGVYESGGRVTRTTAPLL